MKPPIFPEIGFGKDQGGENSGLFTPPDLGERGHRSLVRRLIAVRRRAVFVVARWETPWLWTLAAALDDYSLLSPD